MNGNNGTTPKKEWFDMNQAKSELQTDLTTFNIGRPQKESTPSFSLTTFPGAIDKQPDEMPREETLTERFARRLEEEKLARKVKIYNGIKIALTAAIIAGSFAGPIIVKGDAWDAEYDAHKVQKEVEKQQIQEEFYHRNVNDVASYDQDYQADTSKSPTR